MAGGLALHGASCWSFPPSRQARQVTGNKGSSPSWGPGCHSETIRAPGGWGRSPQSREPAPPQACSADMGIGDARGIRDAWLPSVTTSASMRIPDPHAASPRNLRGLVPAGARRASPPAQAAVRPWEPARGTGAPALKPWRQEDPCASSRHHDPRGRVLHFPKLQDPTANAGTQHAFPSGLTGDSSGSGWALGAPRVLGCVLPMGLPAQLSLPGPCPGVGRP